ncbi:MAG TPA: SusC/RagA family TonB-linked outer membrane protein [Longimicrobiales bacterium]|nr:SusC/RagA family TonB-linked outer membrane protein [Longimicrobiales bacterium]
MRAPRTLTSLVRLGMIALGMLLFTGSASAQVSSVGGLVVDGMTLRPLAGVQIVVVGTTVGSLTDASGRFRINNVPGEQVTLRAVMLGKREARVTARAGDLGIRITMEDEAISLDEIIVTGTAGGTQRRAIGNVVTSVDAEATSALSSIPDVGMMLNARVPGVVIQPATGMVGAGSRIRIRGTTSFSLNDQPLIYVDGVRMNNQVSSGPAVQGFGSSAISRLSDINPADIETIEVIKGPAAATLYGTEASNGVIQIITKRGTAGAKPRINVMTRQGATWFGNAEGRLNEAWYRDANGDVKTMNLIKLERERGTPIFDVGQLQGYGIDINGGTEALRYFVSGIYDHDDGIEPTNRLRRFSGRMNLTFQPDPRVEVSTNVGLIAATTHLARENAGIWHSLRLGSPTLLNTPRRGFWSRPPETAHSVDVDFQKLRRFTGGVQVKHNPYEWLSQRLTLGLDFTFENNQSITERMSEYNAQFYTATAALGSKSVQRRDVTYTTVDYGLTATFDPTPDLNSASSVGLQYYSNFVETQDANGREFPAPGLTAVDALAVNFGGDNYRDNATVGVYFQQQVGWKNRLFLTGALRADDNSAFGRDFEFVAYPKVSASWVVNEEAFWNVGWVDNLRLRFAYGAAGQQPETFAALRTYMPITTGTGTAALSPYLIGNPDLAPERGEEIETGFETSLLEERFGVGLTYYRKRTRDAILLRQQPPSLGFPSTQFVNAGEILNQGIELAVTAHAIRRENVDLSFNFNMSTNDNEVIGLGGDEFISLGTQQHRTGYPVAGYFERRAVSAEVDANGKAFNVMCDGGTGADGLRGGGAPVPCATAPKIYIGRSQPNREGSLSGTLTFLQRFSLYALVDFKTGHLKDNTEAQNRCKTRLICKENLFPQDYPVFTAEMQDATLFATSIRLKDAGFAKLREVSGSVQIPDSWVERIGASRGSVRVAARNLWTWTKWTSIDPEAYRMDQLHTRSEQESMPQLNQFMTTIQITF